ncbi:hypothetical protein GY45DRAFT_554168 [Cubamyces sp. BRFM 1775]|nr:hypothetical protein GY45DRAFT_554168 [Cubamyces sp. BRFM 1775]
MKTTAMSSTLMLRRYIVTISPIPIVLSSLSLCLRFFVIVFHCKLSLMLCASMEALGWSASDDFATSIRLLLYAEYSDMHRDGYIVPSSSKVLSATEADSNLPRAHMYNFDAGGAISESMGIYPPYLLWDGTSSQQDTGVQSPAYNAEETLLLLVETGHEPEHPQLPVGSPILAA